MNRSYSNAIELDTFEDRKQYLYIGDRVAHTTFGNARWMNQRLYNSIEWKRTRDRVIIRDNGCDLGVDGCVLEKRDILVHHINPITESDILNRDPKIFDMDNLICCSLSSHNYIHFGTEYKDVYVERTPNDMSPWRR